jgi:hypothetical protein
LHIKTNFPQTGSDLPTQIISELKTWLNNGMNSNDSEETQSPSEAVLYKIAEQEDVQPEDLNPPLFEVVDPDALDELFREDTGSVSFEYHGYLVTVDHSGKVSLQSVESERG